MSARSPTAWTEYLDSKEMDIREYITYVEPTKIINDQEYTLLSSKMCVSDAFYPQMTNTDALVTLLTFDMYFVNMCGTTSGNINLKWMVRLWADSAQDGNGCDVKLIIDVGGAGETSDQNTQALTTTPTWYMYEDAALINGDGVARACSLQVKATGGDGYVYLGGLLIQSDEYS